MAATEAPKNRSLSGFEDTSVKPLSLPPRAQAPAPAPAETSEAPPTELSPPPPTSISRPSKRNPRSAAARPDPETVGMDQKVRPSNVHVPVDLLDLMAAKKAEMGWSNGELIISAIEATHSELENLILPAAETGGSLFAPRRSRAARTVVGPLTSLNYRLQLADYTTLDGLVEKFGATSRGHLVTVALTAFLTPK